MSNKRDSGGQKLLNVGYGNFVPENRVVAIIGTDSAPVKRLKDYARKKGMLIDATFGRKTKSVIVTDSSHVVLSAIHPEKNAHRMEFGSKNPNQVENSSNQTIETEETDE